MEFDDLAFVPGGASEASANARATESGEAFIACILCGLPFARRFSADISQCYRCHWLLNRLLILSGRPDFGVAAARIAWRNYQRAMDAVREDNEPAPANWSDPLFTAPAPRAEGEAQSIVAPRRASGTGA